MSTVHHGEIITAHDGDHLVAVRIFVDTIGDFVWLGFDPAFQAHDGIPVFWPEELESLKRLTVEELKEVHELKKRFPNHKILSVFEENQNAPPA